MYWGRGGWGDKDSRAEEREVGQGTGGGGGEAKGGRWEGAASLGERGMGGEMV